MAPGGQGKRQGDLGGTYGARSPDSIIRLVRSLAAAIPTARAQRIEAAGHAAPFDATSNFVHVIADTIK